MENDFASKWKVAKACARCHRLKSKCVYEDPTYSSCKRCYDLGIKCSADEDPTAETARRRKIKTPSKLERLVRAVESEVDKIARGEGNGNGTALKEDGKGASTDGENSGNGKPHQTQVENGTLHQSKSKGQLSKREKDPQQASVSSFLASALSSGSDSSFPFLPCQDNLAYCAIRLERAAGRLSLARGLDPAYIWKNIITEDEARRRFFYFHNEMLPWHPVICFPQSFQDFDHLLSVSPLLLLSCILVTTISDHGLSSSTENRLLHSRLNDLINHAIARDVFVEARDFSLPMILSCLVLALWREPPEQTNQFKAQFDMMTAVSISLCMDVGNLAMFSPAALSKDDSVERNSVRSFLAVYASCGSLGLSLPRYQLVSWTWRHDLATKKLLEPHGSLPSPNDVFVCRFAQIICEAQKLSDYFCANGVSMHVLSSIDRSDGLGCVAMLGPDPRVPASVSEVEAVLERHHAALKSAIVSSGYVDENLHPVPEAPKGKYCLLFTYYQVMMVAYDNLVSWCFSVLTSAASNDPLWAHLLAQNIQKFGVFCTGLLNLFLVVNTDNHNLVNYPTFFMYRSLHAIVSLVRLEILIKSEVVAARSIPVRSFYDDLQKYHMQVVRIIENNQHSIVCARAMHTLQRITRWVNIVGDHQKFRNVNIDFVGFTKMSKGVEIEKLAEPQDKQDQVDASESIHKRQDVELDNASNKRQKLESSEYSSAFSVSRFASDPTESAHYTNSCSIQEIFKEMDEDILSFLNPFDTTDYNTMQSSPPF
ncbi:putative molybdopterin synthase sulfur carrier subunit [Clavispora lusitaniae]|uniref:Molybdopterin synthase sulfur carrier subunit n=1 Tax=Clavispora lusitaniae TaxID=36911 RepID=A0AA91Q1P9_CLALS|nr:putative molybdopterin synthase sulfur carrier subunit [Clavispora lusitaniae]